MKTVMRNWPWLAGLTAAGLTCLSFLLAQLQSTLWVANAQSVETDGARLSPPNEVEAAASESLIEAVNSGAVETALTILHEHGVAEDVVLDMASSLGKVPRRAGLKEPFAKAAVALSLAGPP